MNKGIKKRLVFLFIVWNHFSLLRQYSTQISSASPSVQQVTSGEPGVDLLPAAGREGSERPPQFLWSSAFFFFAFFHEPDSPVLLLPVSDADHDVLPASGQLVARGVSAHHGEVSRLPLAAPLQACRQVRFTKGDSDVKRGFGNWTRSSCDSQPRDHLFRLVQFQDCLD